MVLSSDNGFAGLLGGNNDDSNVNSGEPNGIADGIPANGGDLSGNESGTLPGIDSAAVANANADGGDANAANDNTNITDTGADAETEGEAETAAPETEGETETTPWISQPFGYLPPFGDFSVTNGMVLAALGVLLALLAALLLSTRKKKPSKAQQEAPVPAPEPGQQDAAAPTAPVSPAASRGIRAAYHQHIGARKDQQDSCTYSDPALYQQCGVLAVVADGMGGLSNGKAVSSTLVRIYDEGFRRAHPQQNSADLLLELAVRANAQINRMLQGQERSGSTLVAALVKNGYLNFLTVGDSRIYLYRGGALIQLNREHIFQEELAVKAVNQATPLNQVRGDRQAHSLTSYFGIGRIPALDRNDEGIKLINGDRILLATDGVFGTLSAAQLETALAQSANDAATMIGDMIREADKPYQDNNTAVILEYSI